MTDARGKGLPRNETPLSGGDTAGAAQSGSAAGTGAARSKERTGGTLRAGGTRSESGAPLALLAEEIALGGLLHDVGKLVQRSGAVSGNHMDIGADWLSRRKDPWAGSAWAARYHHTNPNASVKLGDLAKDPDFADKLPLAAIVAHADNLSSAEREEVTGRWDAEVRLRNIFDRVVLADRASGQGTPTFFPLAPLTAGAFATETGEGMIFPAPETAQRALFNYEALEEGLRELLDSPVPASERRGSGWLLRALERYTAFVPSETAVSKEEERYPDISLFDHLRTTAMLAVAMLETLLEHHASIFDLKNPYDGIKQALTKEGEHPFLLVEGNIRGIQSYLYDISGTGALRTLRARSFFLELLQEEILGALLNALELPRTQVLFVGGGHFLLVLPNTSRVRRIVEEARCTANRRCRAVDTRLSLLFASVPLAWKALAEGRMNGAFRDLAASLAREKARPCREMLQEVLGVADDSRGKSCIVCGVRTDRLFDLKDREEVACGHCAALHALGGRLSDAVFLWQKPAKDASRGDAPSLPPQQKTGEVPATPGSGSDAEHFENTWRRVRYDTAKVFSDIPPRAARVYVLQRLSEELERQGERFVPLPWAGYTWRGEDELDKILEGGCIGQKKLGALRMDVDDLGRIFQEGLLRKARRDNPGGGHGGDGENAAAEAEELYTLSRLATLSRLLTYFFKQGLPVLARRPEGIRRRYPRTVPLTEAPEPSRAMTLIYAGGDDLYAVGAWNDIAEFASDTVAAFRDFTGGNPCCSISGGMVAGDDKHPVASLATLAARAEQGAKAWRHLRDGRRRSKDALALFFVPENPAYTQSPSFGGADRVQESPAPFGLVDCRNELEDVHRWVRRLCGNGEETKNLATPGKRLRLPLDRAFLRRFFELTEAERRGGVLWRPLAAYAAARGDSNERGILQGLLAQDERALALARIAATWVDWMVR